METALSPQITVGLSLILLAVLVLPFLVKKVEHNLEAFLFVMGVLAVTVAQRWEGHLVVDAILDPIRLKHPIVEAVLLAGLAFRALREPIRHNVRRLQGALGPRLFLFTLVVGLGVLSSVITAIIAALLLAEVMSVMRQDKRTETNIVVVACFAIGLGAVLTPVGEPLATIAVAKLSGEPYRAGFWFLFQNLAHLILPGILAFGIFAMFFQGREVSAAASLTEDDKAETLMDVVMRAAKVYLFVMALVLLGAGFEPVIDAYVIRLSGRLLYWINMVSAVLDNATLTAAELSPRMALDQIQAVLMGLLIAGGMLIPGNIPNIISASKLKIGSTDWARLGVPLGLATMAIYFFILY